MGFTEGGCAQAFLLVTRSSKDTPQAEAPPTASRVHLADAHATPETRIPGAENGTAVYVTFASSITLLTAEATAISPSQCLRLQDALDTPYGLFPAYEVRLELVSFP